MLGIQVAQMAVELESLLEKGRVAEADKQQRLEETILKMLSESTLIGTSEEVRAQEERRREAHQRSTGY